MAHFIRKIVNAIKGKCVGQDQFGNKYYLAKSPDGAGRYRRWVEYNGIEEASKVPPAWHGWLHYTFDEPLNDNYTWQEAPLPNLTGTKGAYFPPGHVKGKRKRQQVSADYQPWNPNQ